MLSFPMDIFNPEPLKKLLPFIDAFNIDLKAFSEEFYKKQTKGKLEPVLETLKIIAQSKAHLEITTLIIPGLNDDIHEFENMAGWISTNLGHETPLHLSRYFPQYELKIQPTSIENLNQIFDIAKRHLSHVYLGNVSDEKRSSTYCSTCGNMLINRSRYHTSVDGIDSSGNCLNLQNSDPGFNFAIKYLSILFYFLFSFRNLLHLVKNNH